MPAQSATSRTPDLPFIPSLLDGPALCFLMTIPPPQDEGNARFTSWSVERNQPDDRGAVVAADPERDRSRRVVDVDAADVGLPREQVFDAFVDARLHAHDP